MTNLFRNAVKFTHKGEIQYGFYVDKEKALAAGCDDVITKTKPADRDLLLHAMKKYLGVE